MRALHVSSEERFRSPFGAAPMGGTVMLGLDVWDDPAATVQLRTWVDGEGETLVDMEATPEGDHTHFTCTITPEHPEIIWYFFKIRRGDGGTTYYGTRDGATIGEGAFYDYEPSSWQISVYLTRETLPEWYKGGIVYQIFPDRFARGDDWQRRVHDALDPERRGPERDLVEDWYQPPRYRKDDQGRITHWDFYGGTLSGVRQKLGYLKALGVTAIYLNPIFEAASNHRYDTADYLRIDPMLGDDEEFQRLCREADAQGISVILDGVFNHTGCDSRYFNKYGNYPTVGAFQSEESPYRSWYELEDGKTYASWWGVDDLPDVVETDPSYHEFICGKDGVVRHWLRMGARGWRLDVADELPDSFIEDIKSATLAEKPDGLVLGEVWEDASNKVSYGKARRYLLGTELDSAMNYPFRTTVLDFLTQKATAPQTAQRFEQLLENYPPEAFYSALNLLGSHDRPRVLTILGGAPDPDTMSDQQRADFRLNDGQRGLAKSRLWVAALLQMTMPGVPCVYYGDEAGLEGYADPYNRATFPWGREDHDCFNIYRNAIAIRKSLPVFVDGDFHPFALNDDVFGFTRSDDECCVMVLANASLQNRHELTVPMRGEDVDDIVGGQRLDVHDGQVDVGLWPLGTAVLYFHPRHMLEADMERGMGVLCHITSIPNDGRPGTLGAPAKRFVDWLASCGQRYWQILPVNPTDSYGSPYAGLSAFAGNTRLVEEPDDELEDECASHADEDEYEEFCQRNDEWLTPYATFRAIKHMLGEKAWQTWPAHYRDYTPELACDPKLAKSIRHHKRRQFVFDKEWRELRLYANTHGIKIIGDMSMYVSADSSDVWSRRRLFQLNQQGYPSMIAGVPPDRLAADGQIWGNPVYDWDAMEQDGYEWWLARLERACELYDIVRLDHFLGFSSYFSIPEGHGAQDGLWHFGPGREVFQRAYQKDGALPFIAEDLGTITPAVRSLVASTGFPGLDVVQFCDQDVSQGYVPAKNKVSCTGTHDTQTLVGWVEDRWHPQDPQAMARDITARALASDATVVMMPLQDVLGLDDSARMNVPGVAEHNWSWQATWEQVDGATDYLRQVAQDSDRFQHLV